MTYYPSTIGLNRHIKTICLTIAVSGLFAVYALGTLAQEPAASPTPATAVTAVAPEPDPDPSPSPIAANKDQEQEKEKKPKRGSFVIAPIPIVNPTFGSGLVVGVGYIFKIKQDDMVSPPSALGLAGAYTNSGTRGLALGGRLYFDKNNYQATFAFGKGRAVIDFYGIGQAAGAGDNYVTIRGTGTIVFTEFMKNVGKNVFIGGRYQYRKLGVRRESEQRPGGFEVPAIDLSTNTNALGFHVQQDRRDNGFYPTKGWVWDVTGDFLSTGRRTYQTYKASFNGYKTIGKDQVLAYRGMGCSVSDDTPFYDLCLFGGSDLRGYATGRYQDSRMFAVQAEYRRELPFRLGLVAFAGVGEVAPGWGDMSFDKLLPAVGAGLRFKLDKKNNINYRIDFGVGRSGYTVSLSVTEAF